MNREVYVCVCVCAWIEGWIVETASKYLCVCEETHGDEGGAAIK